MRKDIPVTWALDHLERCHVIDLELLGEERAAAFVESTWERAASHGFVQAEDLWRYLDLAIFFGAGFDEDPQLPWIGDALRSSTQLKGKIIALWKGALDCLAVISGERGEHYLKALFRAQKLSSSALTVPAWTSPTQALAVLGSVYPEKIRSIGDGFDAVFDLARSLTARDGEAAGVPPVYLLLMLLLGSHFERDLRYPWAREVMGSLKDPAPVRYRKLEAAARLQLIDALALMKSYANLVEKS